MKRIKQYFIVLLSFFVFFSSEIVAQNTVLGPEIAPGLLIGESVTLPVIKLNDTQKLYGKGYKIKPYPGLLEITIESTIRATVYITVETTCNYTTTTCEGTSDSTSRLFEAKRQVFVTYNFEHLEKEMAEGKGERLYTLAYLYGCPHNLNQRFGKMTQNQYAKIFDNPEKLTSASFVKRIKQEIQKDKELNGSCMP